MSHGLGPHDKPTVKSGLPIAELTSSARQSDGDGSTSGGQHHPKRPSVVAVPTSVGDVGSHGRDPVLLQEERLTAAAGCCRPTIVKRRCGYFAMFWMVSGFAPFKFARRRLSHSESKGRMVARPPERCPVFKYCIRLGFRGRSMLGRGMPTSRCECLGPDADRRERRMEHWIRCGWPGSALDALLLCLSELVSPLPSAPW